MNELTEAVFTGYHVKPDSVCSIFYGCSNGGDYGINIINKYPDYSFTHFICFSPVSSLVKKHVLNKNVQSKLYLAYGSDELKSIIGINLQKLDKVVSKNKDPRIHLVIYKGGHEREKWKKEFGNTLNCIFQEK